MGVCTSLVEIKIAMGHYIGIALPFVQNQSQILQFEIQRLQGQGNINSKLNKGLKQPGFQVPSFFSVHEIAFLHHCSLNLISILFLFV